MKRVINKTILIVLIGWFLVGCNTTTSSLQSTQTFSLTQPAAKSVVTSTFPPTPRNTLIPTDTTTLTVTGESTPVNNATSSPNLRLSQWISQPSYQVSSSSLPGWNQVTNLEYGFSLRYPANLQLLTSGNYIWISWEEQDLLIGFHRPGDNVDLHWMNNSNPNISGERVDKGKVKFMDMEIPKYSSTLNNGDWSILYNNGNEFEVKKMADGEQVGRLLFSMVLESKEDPGNPPSGYQGIPAQIQSLADQILMTFTFPRHEYTNWTLFADKEAGISFEYPQQWQAETTISSDPTTTPDAIFKQEQFVGLGGEIYLDEWDARGLNLTDWMDWWHQFTGSARGNEEPALPNASLFKRPAILFVQPGTQAYDMLTLFFSDGKIVYRLQYSMKDRQNGLEVFFKMIYTMKSDLLGDSDPNFPVLDIE